MSQSSSFDSVALIAHDQKFVPGTMGLVLSNTSAKPLTLNDWFDYEEGKPVAVEVTGQVAEGSDVSIPGAPLIGSWVTRKLQLDPSIENATICLVEGGWVPFIYCMTGTNLFLDKNVVAEIKARFDDGRLKEPKPGAREFLHMLEQKACSSVLNPLPSVLEGNIKRLPDVQTVLHQLHAAKADLTKALPHMRIWPEDAYSEEQIVATLGSYQESFAQGIAFLQKVAPKLMAPPGKSKRKAALQAVVQAARDTQIPLQHICVAVSLSVLLASPQFNPAKKVLKPAHVYGAAEAYNAMWDLFMLELLHHFHTHQRQVRCALLTRDTNLALLWTGMELTKQATPCGEVKYTVFHERLMQCEPEEVELLQSLLGVEGFSYRTAQ